jgi:hypothetical protein
LVGLNLTDNTNNQGHLPSQMSFTGVIGNYHNRSVGIKPAYVKAYNEITGVAYWDLRAVPVGFVSPSGKVAQENCVYDAIADVFFSAQGVSYGIEKVREDYV